MKRWMCAFTFLLLGFVGMAQEKFSKEAILEDFAYLKSSLEQTHFDLYAFTPRSVFQRQYDSLLASVVQDSLSVVEANGLFQAYVGLANTGHAEIAFPIDAYLAYAQEGGTVLPIDIVFEKGKAVILQHYSPDASLEIGAELLAINGRSISDILASLYPQLSAETPYFKQAKLEFYSLPRLYWKVFGQQDSFRLKVKDKGGVRIVKTAAVEVFEGFENKRREPITQTRLLEFREGTAYIKPGEFGGDLSEFQAFIDSAFAEIRNRTPHSLILDLRNHGGGDDPFSNYLVSYFASRPFKWCSHFRLKTNAILKQHTRQNSDTTDAYFREILNRENGETYAHDFEAYAPQDSAKRFQGKVFVLINRHTYSMAAVTAAMLQDYGFAMLLGEETGDHPSLYASQFSYSLPQTGMLVRVPKGYMVRPNGEASGRGVIPDEPLPFIVGEMDQMLEAAWEQVLR